ncbi:hypothetical protein BCR33DRAFT_426813 [Rhizoclosmatium globosum]|uniref:Uncharacterized protein n=1 Tax=Rhizoclosmatium globosum TaxID=329046 RepID=A0A1Y2BV57_9FUNG|nr:hypothetical protein BCR33DRAFT_426813 [Rhizoclosmatium globosum]|eukprot:ORY38623.1 hypothetical protein BCR33DRAFT_426813 [Rhizoclosmatium globosum]
MTNCTNIENLKRLMSSSVMMLEFFLLLVFMIPFVFCTARTIILVTWAVSMVPISMVPISIILHRIFVIQRILVATVLASIVVPLGRHIIFGKVGTRLICRSTESWYWPRSFIQRILVMVVMVAMMFVPCISSAWSLLFR